MPDYCECSSPERVRLLNGHGGAPYYYSNKQEGTEEDTEVKREKKRESSRIRAAKGSQRASTKAKKRATAQGGRSRGAKHDADFLKRHPEQFNGEWPCPSLGCTRRYKSKNARDKHIKKIHPDLAAKHGLGGGSGCKKKRALPPSALLDSLTESSTGVSLSRKRPRARSPAPEVER